MAARFAPLVTVLLLTVLALAVRVNGLDWRDGNLSTDEARVGLAARGVLQTGLPLLPAGAAGTAADGRLYTRGLVTIYATAPSLALFGVHDWSVRLPSILLGAFLVPAVFLLGREVGGVGPGLAAAVVVVVAGPLVAWSRQAWPPAAFLLLLTLTTYALVRGFVRDEARWQIWAALGFLLTLLSYELAVLLPAGLGLYLLGRAARGDWRWWQGRATLAALAIGGLALGLLALMGLLLRAGTLAGADAEFRHYFTPTIRLTGVGYYWRQVWDTVLPLALLAPAGLVWRWTGRRGAGQSESTTLPPGLGLLAALLLVALLIPTFIIQDKQEQQYGLAVLPLAAALWAWGLAALRRPHSPAPERGLRGEAFAVGLAVLTFALVLGGDTLTALRPRTPPQAATWLDELRARGFQSSDPSVLLLAEAPLVTQLYLGRADFYVHPEGFERYAYDDGTVVRSLYTPAVLLKQAGDFERLVNEPYAGRTLWIVGQDDRLPRLARQMDADLWRRLQGASGVSRATRGWWIMRVQLPV
jgi:4-amino-4-deoxy-L-arabinose transferase-like glycosyltransferase